MVSRDAANALEDLASAVAGSRSDRAIEAALRGLKAGAPALEVLRAAAKAAALHYDPAPGRPPLGLIALASAANLFPFLQERVRPLPVLQAIALAAAVTKAPRPAKPPLIVSGEITHLGRSFLFATRDGNLPEAEAIFLGILDEGWERRMAGDMLFRAAMEDMGDGGRKLVVAVELWQLARALGFQDARVLLRPAVQYLVAGPRDSRAFSSILQVLGKGWVDLDPLATGGDPIASGGRGKIAKVLGSSDDAACVAGVLALLREGISAASFAEALSLEAARRAVATKGGEPSARAAFAYAHAVRFVLAFTRTSEKLYALFQAALRLRGPSPEVRLPSVPDAPGEGEDLCEMAGDLDGGRPDEAAARVRSYVGKGYSSARLEETLALYASRNAASEDGGQGLLLADVATFEFLSTKAAEPAMALAAILASSTKHTAAYEAWKPLFGL